MDERVKKIRSWIRNPVKFVVDNFGVEPDPWQAEVLKEFPHNQRIAMKACKGPGKTTVLAWLAWHFISTRPDAKMAATSITEQNLSDNLWPELAKWRERSRYLKAKFEWTKTRITCREAPENWFLSARTWAKSGDKQKQSDALAGLHADYLMFILDESGGIPDAVMATAEAGLATGIETKIVQAGNPTHLEGPLYRACTSERDLWFVVEITGDPDDPNRSPRISKQWAREQIQKYGKDNPWVLVNVFGKFPPASINTLLGPDEVSKAMRTNYHEDGYKDAQKRLGIDVARFGDDRTIIFPRQGLVAFRPVEMRNARTNEIAARVALAKQKWESEVEFIDDTGGWGAGVIDSLIQSGYTPQGINFSGKAIDGRYYNKRAEIWFEMANWIKRGGSIPKMDELVKELTAPTYTFHNGKFKLEEKEQIKERLGYSPDLADALCLTFSLPELPKRTDSPFEDKRRQQAKHEWNPFD